MFATSGAMKLLSCEKRALTLVSSEMIRPRNGGSGASRACRRQWGPRVQVDALAQQHKTGEYRKGEDHCLAKLDEDKVRAMYAEWKQYDRKTLDGRSTRRSDRTLSEIWGDAGMCAARHQQEDMEACRIRSGLPASIFRIGPMSAHGRRHCRAA